ncbi:hypothetical protein [Streptomyces sp. NPDC058291]|jgi:hypothetical protein|uniref:hypothetical protein n=1 Tax=Streptomyces sp. NPDC058291 TaxID=3346427 RepID=UPI0036E1C523
MTIPEELRSALRDFRAVRARKPPGSAGAADPVDWHEAMAAALDTLAAHLVHESDRIRARDSATGHREEAARLRRPQA